MVKIDLRQLSGNLLPVFYATFIFGFFLFPSTKFHSNFYYISVAFPFVILILMKKVDLRPLFSSRTFLLIILYLVYMFCTLFWADSLGLSDLSKYGRRVLYVLIFVSVTIHLTQWYPNFLQRLLMLLCWTAVIVAIVTIIFFYRQNPFPENRLHGYGLLWHTFYASSLYGIIILACIYLQMSQTSVGMRLFYLGLVLVSFFYMLLAQSRIALFSLVGAMIAWQLLAWLLLKQEKGTYRKMPLIVFLVIVVASTAFFILYPEFFGQKFLSGYSLSRLQLWGKILEQVKDAPWFGHGLTADPRAEYVPGEILVHPHSVWVGTLFYGGIVGLLLFIAVLVSAFWQGFGSVKQSINSVAACMVLYGALCIVPNGNMLIHHPKPFWLFFWFPLALVVASEIRGHPLRGEYMAPDETGLTRVAVE